MARYTASVEHVEDGDTFKTANEIWIMLADIDCPEKSEPGYTRAKEALTDLILGKKVSYEPTGRDTYNRVLAHVWVNDTYVNQYMRNHGCRKIKTPSFQGGREFPKL